MIYDLIIVGAGSAGLMAAKTIASKGMSVLILEKGLDFNKRRDLTSGWFGRGIFAMDSLELEDNLLLNSKSIKEAFNFIKKFSSNIEIVKENGKDKFCRLPDSIGKDIASNLQNFLSGKINVMFNSEVKKITKHNEIFVIETAKNVFNSKRCLISTGRNSAKWIEELCNSLKLNVINYGVKIGVRVEIPTFKINNIASDLKIENLEDIRINSFVGEWEDLNIISAFGHCFPDKESKRTNFMVGSELNITTEEAIRNIKIVNILSNDRIKKERIIDYLEGKSVLEHIKLFSNLKKTFIEIEKILPQFINYAIMYIPEIKLNGMFPVDKFMKTSIEKLYGAGECTSRVNTLLGAMASGLISAKTILKE